MQNIDFKMLIKNKRYTWGHRHRFPLPGQTLMYKFTFITVNNTFSLTYSAQLSSDQLSSAQLSSLTQPTKTNPPSLPPCHLPPPTHYFRRIHPSLVAAILQQGSRDHNWTEDVVIGQCNTTLVWYGTDLTEPYHIVTSGINLIWLKGRVYDIFVIYFVNI